MKYSYKAMDSAGQSLEAEIEVASEKDLEIHFTKNKLIPLRVTEKGASVSDSGEGGKRGLFQGISLWWTSRLMEAELIAFTRQFAAAYGAGIAVGRTLDLLAKQCAHQLFKKALEAISKKVQDGKGLTECFQLYPDFFNRTYVAILHSGEISGNLDQVLNYSANLLEKKLLHSERLRATLLYPKLVLGMIGITSTVVVVFVIPQFAKLYDKFEAPLPLPTQIMLQVSKVVVGYWWMAAVLIPCLLWLIAYLRKHVGFMLWWHEMVVNMPLLGKTFLKIELTHFCTTFSLLLRSGIKITDATTIAINSMSNTYMRGQFATIIPAIEQGGTLAEALNKVPVVPALMASMVAIGEETGTLENLLERVSVLYDHESELMLKKLPTLLEPVVLSILFVMVGMLALAVYLPMWKMASLLRR